ncbi:MAG: DUF2793 domain-containing protein [Sphingobium sp.]
MASDASDRFFLPLLQAGQAQKEITHNEALTLIDAIMHAQAESAVVSAPPGGAAAGQCWIVASGGSAEWSGHDGELACMTSGGWRFVVPRKGMRVSAADDGQTYVHDGSGWLLDPVRPDGFYIGDVRIVGAREAAIADPAGGSVVDSEARTTLGAILTMLRNHGIIYTV